MPADKERDVYLDTIARLEPVIAMIDPGAYYASAAISLKRIADSLEIIAATHQPVVTPDETPRPVPPLVPDLPDNRKRCQHRDAFNNQCDEPDGHSGDHYCPPF